MVVDLNTTDTIFQMILLIGFLINAIIAVIKLTLVLYRIIKKKERKKLIQVYFFVFLFLGIFGRIIYYVMEIVTKIEKREVFPEFLSKIFMFVPSYPLGCIFIILLLNWCEIFFNLQKTKMTTLNVNQQTQGVEVETKHFRITKFLLGAIVFYILLIVNDTIICLIRNKNWREEFYFTIYMFLKIVSSIFYFIFLSITGK
jgi:hypothetical protein